VHLLTISSPFPWRVKCILGTMLCKKLFSRTLPQKQIFYAVQKPAFTYLFTFMTHSQTDSLASCWSICSARLIYINILHTCFNPYTEEAIRLIASHLWFCCDRERGFAFINAAAFVQLMLRSTALTCCIHTLQFKRQYFYIARKHWNWSSGSKDLNVY